jgi:hypothetical protein
MEGVVMSNNQKNAVEYLSGHLSAPVTAPVGGFFELISFLDQGGHLSGGSISAALSRCGVCTTDQDGAKFSFRPHGLFQRGVVSDEARELLSTLAADGFTGTLFYLVGDREHEMVLQDGFCIASDDTYTNVRAYG